MLASYIQQFDTLQQYLRCLFDSFGGIDFNAISKQIINKSNQVIFGEIIQVMIAYGKKIMEMSEQSTYKYRNQHFLLRKTVQEELKNVYSLLVNEETQESYEQIVQDLVMKLRSDRKSIIQKISLPESRFFYSQVKNQGKKTDQRQTLQEDRASHVTNRPSSKGKSKVSKVTSIKQVLQIKNYFENEENKIRQYFEKVNKMFEHNKIMFNSNQNEKFKYSRLSDEKQSENIADLVKLATENHSKNIDNMINLVEIFNENLGKRLKNEGFAEAKLNMFLEEAQRMEEVYSYSLSKMLQNLRQAKQSIEQDPNICHSYLQNLEQITRKLYGLYPTHESLKEIRIKIKSIDDSKKNYGIQVNIDKKNQEKRISSQSFRLQVKINQCLERFQKNNKYRKNFQSKELQKLFQNIRQHLPSKYTPNQTEIAFQQQYKRLTQMSEKQQKELNESFNKKVKKYEKKIQQLQSQIAELRKHEGTINEEWQNEKKKFIKRLQSEQSDHKKLSKDKQVLQKHLNAYLKDIQHLKQAIRTQNEEESSYRKRLQNEKDNIKQKYEINYKKFNDLTTQYYNQRQKMSQERMIYKQKIQLLQRKMSQSQQFSTGLKIELEGLIMDNDKLQSDLNQMSKVYQDKIKEVEEMIENIRELHKVKNNQELLLEKMYNTERKYQEKIEELQKDFHDNLKKVQKDNEQKVQLMKQITHWKQQGKLTDGDLKMLKDEVQKVNNAYLQSEEMLQNLKYQLNSVTEERQRFFRQKIKLNRLVEDLQSQLHSFKSKSQSLELSERDLRDEYHQKSQETFRLHKQNEEIKRQLHKTRKQLHEQKEQRLKIDKEYRQIRQQNQNRKEGQSIDNGKRRIQLQNLRMELRKKTEQIDKQRESYQEKINIITQKMKQMQEFTGQKQQLSRLLQNHQTK